MGAGHDHATSEITYERPLWWALGLTTTFLDRRSRWRRADE